MADGCVLVISSSNGPPKIDTFSVVPDVKARDLSDAIPSGRNHALQKTQSLVNKGSGAALGQYDHSNVRMLLQATKHLKGGVKIPVDDLMIVQAENSPDPWSLAVQAEQTLAKSSAVAFNGCNAGNRSNGNRSGRSRLRSRLLLRTLTLSIAY